MVYLYPIPLILIFSLVYIVCKQWDLKIFALISKIIIIISVIFFLITFASHLGYNIPVISNFFNNLI